MPPPRIAGNLNMHFENSQNWKKAKDTVKCELNPFPAVTGRFDPTDHVQTPVQTRFPVNRFYLIMSKLSKFDPRISAWKGLRKHTRTRKSSFPAKYLIESCR